MWYENEAGDPVHWQPARQWRLTGPPFSDTRPVPMIHAFNLISVPNLGMKEALPLVRETGYGGAA
ncbi:MAG: hypothetical protein GVY10_04120 [Verrucomicrobia bacterium]|jgi:hypothetical protein|nr:hypothetical protein [Verrucomicrobiota bacterium]